MPDGVFGPPFQFGPAKQVSFPPSFARRPASHVGEVERVHVDGNWREEKYRPFFDHRHP